MREGYKRLVEMLTSISERKVIDYSGNPTGAAADDAVKAAFALAYLESVEPTAENILEASRIMYE